MKMLLMRVTDEEESAILEKAGAEGAPQGDELRWIVNLWLGSKPSKKELKGAAGLLHLTTPRETSERDCDHPPSRIIQSPNGPLCDVCGSFL